jgi:hypothetical protein
MALHNEQARSGGYHQGPKSWRRWAKRGLARKSRRADRRVCQLQLEDVPRRWPVHGYAD